MFRTTLIAAAVLGVGGPSLTFAGGLAALQNHSQRDVCSVATTIREGDKVRTGDRLGEFRAQWGRRFGRPMSPEDGAEMKLIGYACNRGGGPIFQVAVNASEKPYEVVLYEGKKPDIPPKVPEAEQRFVAVDKPLEAGSTPFQVTNRSPYPICRVVLMHESFDLESVGIGPGSGIYRKAFPGERIIPGQSALFFLKNRGRFGIRLIHCDKKRWIYRSDNLSIQEGGLELVLGRKKVERESPVPVFAGLTAKVVKPKLQLCKKYALRTTKGDDRCRRIADPSARQRCLDQTQRQVQIGDPERMCSDLQVNAMKKIPLR